jgi:adenosylmethionine-8-amino-7-oxononanoate aminotransferase
LARKKPVRRRGASAGGGQAPDDVVGEVLEESLQVGMLLEEQEGEEDPEPHGEDEYFLKAPKQGPRHPPMRPARSIAMAPGAARPEPTAPGPSNAPGRNLFPRNFTVRYPIAVKSRGIWIHDSDGKEYLDGSGGAVVSSIGHGVKEIADVMTRQAKRLAFAHSSQFITRESIGLAERLAALCPGDMKETGRVYLVSGGSEAVETAIKIARQYQIDSGRPGKSKIIARWQSYHGSTMGALALTGNVARRAFYQPMFADMPHIPPCFCYRCPYGLKFPSCDITCAEDLESAINQNGPDSIAAFIAEPIVGATLGAVPAVDGYWKRVREICTKHDVLLIADEVMTGIGRTGKNFGVDHWKVIPDLVVTGKGLSAGYTPLGAVVARGFVTDALSTGHGYFEHGLTYSANPLSAAIGSAVLDYITGHRLIARAARMGRTLQEKLGTLRRHRIVGDVRGIGLLWGVELVRDRKTREPFDPSLRLSRRLFQACLQQGLIIYPGSGTRQGRDGDHFLIAPPFNVTSGELDELVARLDRALLEISRSLR